MKDTMTEYDRGYNKGYNNRKIEEEFEKSNDYEQGLNDAWELTRKLIISDYDGAYSAKDMRDIWKHGGFLSILKDFTAQQALEKLREYKKKKKVEIHVGDEIYSELTDSKAVVQRIDTWHRYQCFNNEGAQFIIDTETFNNYWVKTGKNYPQIAEVLKQMKMKENEE
jgi:ribonuclease HI